MAKKGSWSRERDARKAARDSGLKDDDFEIVSGSKGFSIRAKKKHIPVPNAKLHVGKEPEEPQPTITNEQLREAVQARVDLDSDVDAEQMTHSDAGGCCDLHPPVVEELPPSLQEEIKAEGLDPAKEEERVKPTFTEKEQEQIRTGAEESRALEEFRKSTNGPMTQPPMVLQGALPPGTFSQTSIPRPVQIPRIHKSTVEGPSKLVWHIADEMLSKNPKVSRKEVITECVRRGIAFYTARTQYQQWLTAHKESNANSEIANRKN